MKNLKARLTKLQSQTGGVYKPRNIPSETSSLRHRLAGMRAAHRAGPVTADRTSAAHEALTRQLKGYRIAEGVIRVEQRHSLDARLGLCHLAGLKSNLRLPGEGREANLRQVYVDTETTGLSGGSGTVAFLVGMAVVEGDALVVTQYLLTGFVGEAAMLRAFAQALTPEDRLVSYNGKSFDLPLLTTRYRMQGQKHPFEGLAHLDLLHPVRRLFRRHWPDCRLLTLEERLLGLRREHDLPGSEAPAAWSDFLRQGSLGRLIRVMEHNRQDIVSLAAAHASLVEAIAHPHGHELDIVSLARWLAGSDSRRAYEMLKTTDQPLDDRGRRLMAKWARNEAEWGHALKIWQELADEGCRDSAEQLAKYYEHVSQDLSAARRYCELMTPGSERTRRLQRILSKQDGQSMQPRIQGF